MPIVNVVRFEAKDVITTSGVIAIDNNPKYRIQYAETKSVQVSDPTRFVW